MHDQDTKFNHRDGKNEYTNSDYRKDGETAQHKYANMSLVKLSLFCASPQSPHFLVDVDRAVLLRLDELVLVETKDVAKVVLVAQ